jgi:tricorn protease
LEFEEDQKSSANAEPEPEPTVAGGAAAEETADNPVSGSWKGSMSTPEGAVPFAMVLTLRVDGTVTGTVVTQSFIGAVDGTWDQDRNRLEVAYTPDGSDSIAITATISGDEMSGGVDLATGNAPFLARLQSAEDVEEIASELAKDDEDEDAVDEVIIDFEDVHSRMRRVTNREGNERALGWGPDSEKVYFNTSFGTRLTTGTTGETGLFTVDVRELDVENVHSSSASSFTRSGKAVYYVRGGKIVGGAGKAKSYGFSVSFREQRRALREAVMEQAWRILDRNFYDENFHSHDWASSLEKWLPLALAASTKEDYAAIVNWMLGEMNASHMGYFGGGRTRAAEIDSHSTGRLGVLWDESHDGAGRKVAEVLPRTPAARSISRLAVGEVVLAVNGVVYQAGDNWARLMLGTVGKETRLQVLGADGNEREVVIRPTGSLSGALYERDTRVARAHVDEKSAGRLGYLHIQGMSTPSLLDFERELYAAGKGKEVLLIDVRENGGGWTTDMLLTMLMVRDHAITIPRGGGQGYPQGRRIFATWDKPIVVLCNENSYSNAEIFSWAIKTLKRGPIVGKQTYGAVISTGGAGLLDGSFVRLPFRGWYVADEGMTNMELNGCPPDYPVENLPGDFAEGVDRQLDKAIEIGLSL